MSTERKKILLRLDPAVYDALTRWAGDELRSTTAQIEFVLRRALGQVGRMPGDAGEMPRRGRPPKTETETETGAENENEADEPPDGGAAESPDR